MVLNLASAEPLLASHKYQLRVLYEIEARSFHGLVVIMSAYHLSLITVGYKKLTVGNFNYK